MGSQSDSLGSLAIYKTDSNDTLLTSNEWASMQ